MESEDYKVFNNTKEQQLEIQGPEEKATLSYRFYKHNIAFMHTTVPSSMSGHGVGGILARAAFDYAKSLHKPVMVYCPFVASFLEKHPEFRSQLDKTYHA
ncbi:GNAT family N-acetyltransferase [Chitinophaga dinghuensis]|nr:GNAT family N-acetyltransferase [Chitinophaga dinghuensis]